MRRNQPIKILGFIMALALAITACQFTFNLPRELQLIDTGVQEQEAEDNGSGEGYVPQPTLVSAVEPKLVTSVDLISQQDALIALYENVSPGVVAILIYGEESGVFPLGSGSGFVIDKEGHIVTNFHVVYGAEEIQITFPSGIKVRGEVIGTDADSDLAIIKVDVAPEDLHPLPLGDSDEVKVGQIVIAIGNPFGLNGTMTTGIVSGLGRTLDSLNEAPGGNQEITQYYTAGDIIQTDAAINPGNSGGPLLNLDGEVIGVNRAIRTFSTNADLEPVNSGIGFAVSVNIVKRVTPGLIANGSFDYPYLGVSSWPEIPLIEAERLGMDRAVGALITRVVEGGPADEAGLRVDDVILQINDEEVRHFGDLIAYLFTDTSPGDVVELLIWRGSEEITVSLELGARP